MNNFKKVALFNLFYKKFNKIKDEMHDSLTNVLENASISRILKFL